MIMGIKIPLRITPERLILGALVRGKRFAGPIEFFVDTGSPVSFIGSQDSLRLNIPMMGSPVRTAKIGGSSIGLHALGEVTKF